MAIMMTLFPGNASSSGIGLARGTTIAVLATAIVLREGFICVIMALPLIISVIAIITYASTATKAGNRAALVVPLMAIILSGEGVVYELPSRDTVEETRLIDATSAELIASLATRAELPELEPVLFKLPFPAPVEFEGAGLYIGATRTIDFGDTGAMQLEITELAISEGQRNHLTWTFVEDTTPIGKWMTLYSATATWTETAEGLELSVEIEYDRSLAPALYFEPLERWGVGEMAEVLLDMIEHNLDLASEN